VQITGLSGDSLSYQEKGVFSSPDKDFTEWHCATEWQGSWWFGTQGCHQAYLNGPYRQGGNLEKVNYARGIIWKTWTSWDYSLKFTEMKMRPYNTV